MDASAPKNNEKTPAEAERESKKARLSKALRDNLRRRRPIGKAGDA